MVHLFPSGWSGAEIKVYCLCCSQTAHKLVWSASAKYAIGVKSLLSQYIYCGCCLWSEVSYIAWHHSFIVLEHLVSGLSYTYSAVGWNSFWKNIPTCFHEFFLHFSIILYYEFFMNILWKHRCKEVRMLLWKLFQPVAPQCWVNKIEISRIWIFRDFLIDNFFLSY